jgi:hypothetical protein
MLKISPEAAELMSQDDVETQVEGDGKRERSTIKFPYGDLSDAVDVTQGVHKEFGTSCQWEQLAAQLKLAADGGGFRQKMLTAKLFGVVDYSQRKVTLTALGSRLCDPKQEKAAKADAFLTVPLYRAVYEKFKGNILPPANALESEMAGMGVAEKQADKARQYFQRSAEQAGFFWSGSDRLVMPANKPNGESGLVDPPKDIKKDSRQSGGGDDGSGIECDPAIKGLIKRLPPPDSDWSLEKQVKWLLAVATAFDVIYPRADDGRSLKIEIEGPKNG